MKKNRTNNPSHIVLTSHPPRDAARLPKVSWGAKTLQERGPLIASMADRAASNVIGAYAGAYSVYRAVAVATGALDPLHVPDLHNTAPPEQIEQAHAEAFAKLDADQRQQVLAQLAARLQERAHCRRVVRRPTGAAPDPRTGLAVLEFEHLRWSQTRFWMALYMGAAMAVVMLAFMWSMYKGQGTKMAVDAAAAVLGAVALGGRVETEAAGAHLARLAVALAAAGADAFGRNARSGRAHLALVARRRVALRHVDGDRRHGCQAASERDSVGAGARLVRGGS